MKASAPGFIDKFHNQLLGRDFHYYQTDRRACLPQAGLIACPKTTLNVSPRFPGNAGYSSKILLYAYHLKAFTTALGILPDWRPGTSQGYGQYQCLVEACT
jgi:hypothetical protein